MQYPMFCPKISLNQLLKLSLYMTVTRNSIIKFPPIQHILAQQEGTYYNVYIKKKNYLFFLVMFDKFLINNKQDIEKKKKKKEKEEEEEEGK